jgi:hypothetical protein
MGMDVVGTRPLTPSGEYFRNNVWYWRPLWDYCCSVDSTLFDKVPLAHSNDGDGLDASEARKLAFKLQEEIDSGRAEKFVNDYEAHRASLDKIPCIYCDEGGNRSWPTKTGESIKKVCNACNGTRFTDSWESYYPMSLENIQSFTSFLMDCGGFRIW